MVRHSSLLVKLVITLIASCVALPSTQAQTGACCVGSSCSLRTLSSCDNVGGDWQGPGTNCSGSPCASPPGTCCNGTTCTIRTDAQCAAGGGSFLGGAACAPNPCSGSCCVNGNCSITALATCTSSGGAWLRFGSCSPNICPGPCCDNGTCTVTVQSLCAGNRVWTPGSACFPNPCPAPQCDFGVTANTGGSTTAVARVGTTGLLVARGTTLEMYNAVNTSAPAPFSPPRRALLPSPAAKIVAPAGSSQAFVLLEEGGVVCFQIVTSPQLLIGSSLQINGAGVSDIAADGDRVFIPSTLNQHPQGVLSEVFIYQRTGSGSLSLLGTFEPFLQDFRIDRIVKVGNVLWLGMHLDGSSTYAIEGWDVTDPAAPIRRGSIAAFAELAGETEITAMQAVGNKVLISFRNATIPSVTDRLRAADVTNPSSPAWQPAVEAGGTVQCMSANGSQLRVGRGANIQTWDTTGPGGPVLLGTLTDPSVVPLQISSGAASDYLAVGRHGLRTASFSTPAAPQILATLTTHPSGAGLVRQIGASTVVYDNAFDTLRVFDYTLQENQQLRGSLPATLPFADMLEVTLVNSGAQRLALVGSSVTGTVRVFDVTLPTAPSSLSTISDADVWKMSATNARLYVLSRAAELKVYSLANPGSPALLSTTQYGGTQFDYTCITSWQIGATQAVALGTAAFGLWLIDLADPASPQVVAVHQPVVNYYVESLTRGTSYLYVSSTAMVFDTRLESLNVDNLANPVVSYVTGPELGAGEPSTFSALSYISTATGRFLMGLDESRTAVRLWDLSSPFGEAVLHRIFFRSIPSSYNTMAVNPAGWVILGAGDADFLQIRLPETWAPGFSAPALSTREVCLGGSVALTAQASARSQTITYQWFKFGNPSIALTNGPMPSGAIASGATSPTLTISNIHAQDNSTFYFCTATHACGPRSTSHVKLALCIADFNCSGTMTVQDIFDFLAAFFAGNTLADVNGAGGLSVQDIFDFLATYFAGCE